MKSKKNNKICLFSAPHYFLSDLKKKKNSKTILFKESWKKKELKINKNIKYWILNPGINYKVNIDILKIFPNLKYVITPSTGTNHIDYGIKKNGVRIFSLKNKINILRKIKASSEFTFLLILNSLRNLFYANHQVKLKNWRKNENLLRGEELNHKVVGIVGLGRIGKNIAKWSKSFGAKVIFFDPYKKRRSNIKKVSIKKLFKMSDIICISCTLNTKTTNMINIKLFKLMKKNVHLINTSRGEIINENDLFNFLKHNKSAKVSLDVLRGETLNKHYQSKLYKYIYNNRILVTPHIAGASFESQKLAAKAAIEIFNLCKKK